MAKKIKQTVASLTVTPVKLEHDNKDAFLARNDEIINAKNKGFLEYLTGLLGLGMSIITGLSQKQDCLSAYYDDRHLGYFAALVSERGYSATSAANLKTRILQLTVSWHVYPAVLSAIANAKTDKIESNFFVLCSCIAGYKGKPADAPKYYKRLCEVPLDLGTTPYKEAVYAIMGKQAKTRVSKKMATLGKGSKLVALPDTSVAQGKPHTDPDRDNTPETPAQKSVEKNPVETAATVAAWIKTVDNMTVLESLKTVILKRIIELSKSK